MIHFTTLNVCTYLLAFVLSFEKSGSVQLSLYVVFPLYVVCLLCLDALFFNRNKIYIECNAWILSV